MFHQAVDRASGTAAAAAAHHIAFATDDDFHLDHLAVGAAKQLLQHLLHRRVDRDALAVLVLLVTITARRRRRATDPTVRLRSEARGVARERIVLALAPALAIAVSRRTDDVTLRPDQRRRWRHASRWAAATPPVSLKHARQHIRRQRHPAAVAAVAAVAARVVHHRRRRRGGLGEARRDTVGCRAGARAHVARLADGDVAQSGGADATDAAGELNLEPRQPRRAELIDPTIAFFVVAAAATVVKANAASGRRRALAERFLDLAEHVGQACAGFDRREWCDGRRPKPASHARRCPRRWRLPPHPHRCRGRHLSALREELLDDLLHRAGSCHLHLNGVAAADAEQVSEFRGQAVRATGSTHFPFRLHVVVP